MTKDKLLGEFFAFLDQMEAHAVSHNQTRTLRLIQSAHEALDEKELAALGITPDMPSLPNGRASTSSRRS